MDIYLTHRNLLDRVMFALGIYTGRRISDLVRLNVRDVAHIDRKGRLCIVERLMIHEQKTGKFADPLIHPKVRRILSKYLRQRRKHSKIGTHSLRKTFGYIQHQNVTSIDLIQRMLNHSSPEITLAYIGITRDDMDEAILSMD